MCERSASHHQKATRAPKVPPGGWTWENTSGSAGPRLLRAMVTVQLAERYKSNRKLRKVVRATLTKQMTAAVTAFIDGLGSIYGPAFVAPVRRKGAQVRKSIETFTLDVPTHGELWARAIAQAMAEAGHELDNIVLEEQTRVATAVYERQSLLLGGGSLNDFDRRVIAGRVQDIGGQVRNINATTQRQLQRAVTNSLEAGETPFELIATLRRRIPQFAGNRAAVIARTESFRATDAGTFLAMRESGVVTHFSIVGCEAIEKRSPTYHGIHTCNIQNVPIEDAFLVRFHPNHTGTPVASGFLAEDDRTRPKRPLRAGTPGDPASLDDVLPPPRDAGLVVPAVPPTGTPGTYVLGNAVDPGALPSPAEVRTALTRYGAANEHLSLSQLREAATTAGLPAQLVDDTLVGMAQVGGLNRMEVRIIPWDSAAGSLEQVATEILATANKNPIATLPDIRIGAGRNFPVEHFDNALDKVVEQRWGVDVSTLGLLRTPATAHNAQEAAHNLLLLLAEDADMDETALRSAWLGRGGRDALLQPGLDLLRGVWRVRI